MYGGDWCIYQLYWLTKISLDPILKGILFDFFTKRLFWHTLRVKTEILRLKYKGGHTSEYLWIYSNVHFLDIDWFDPVMEKKNGKNDQIDKN